MLDYNRIRPDVREALDAYVEHRRPVGGFLEAVLSNDLIQAFARADDYNRETMFHIVGYIYNEIPSVCWGSRSNVISWIRGDTHDRSRDRGTSAS